MRSKVYETVERPSVSPSVCLSVPAAVCYACYVSSTYALGNKYAGPSYSRIKIYEARACRMQRPPLNGFAAAVHSAAVVRGDRQTDGQTQRRFTIRLAHTPSA